MQWGWAEQVKVTVLGSGIVGLWTADILSMRGHEVEVRSAGSVNGSTSAAAVAVITPLFPGSADDDAFRRGLDWYHSTLEHFLSLESGRFVESLPSYEFGFSVDGERFLEKEFHVDKFADLGLNVEFLDVEPPVPVQNHVDEVQHLSFGARIETPLCNSEEFLPWLAGKLRTQGVSFVSGVVASLEDLREIRADVIVNCLGFGAFTLFPDPLTWTVRGQSMFIPATHTSGPAFGIAAGNHAVFKHSRGYYVGSYFLEGDAETRTRPHQIEYELSFGFVRDTYPNLCIAAGFEVPEIDLDEISRVNCGLRPFRDGGPRVEFEEVVGVPIVHNYGHGAHGWTVGYGTSVTAADIVEAMLL